MSRVVALFALLRHNPKRFKGLQPMFDFLYESIGNSSLFIKRLH